MLANSYGCLDETSIVAVKFEPLNEDESSIQGGGGVVDEDDDDQSISSDPDSKLSSRQKTQRNRTAFTQEQIAALEKGQSSKSRFHLARQTSFSLPLSRIWTYSLSRCLCARTSRQTHKFTRESYSGKLIEEKNRSSLWTTRHDRFGFPIDERNGDVKRKHAINGGLTRPANRQPVSPLWAVHRFSRISLHHHLLLLHPQQCLPCIIRQHHRRALRFLRQATWLNRIFHLRRHLSAVTSRRELQIPGIMCRIRALHPTQHRRLIRIHVHPLAILIHYPPVSSLSSLASISRLDLFLVNCYEEMAFPHSTYTRPPSYHSHHASDYTNLTSNAICQSCMFRWSIRIGVELSLLASFFHTPMPLQSSHLSSGAASSSSLSGTNSFWDRFWQWLSAHCVDIWQLRTTLPFPCFRLLFFFLCLW